MRKSMDLIVETGGNYVTFRPAASVDCFSMNRIMCPEQSRCCVPARTGSCRTCLLEKRRPARAVFNV